MTGTQDSRTAATTCPSVSTGGSFWEGARPHQRYAPSLPQTLNSHTLPSPLPPPPILPRILTSPLPSSPATLNLPPCTLNFPRCGPSSPSKPCLAAPKPPPLGPFIPSGTLAPPHGGAGPGHPVEPALTTPRLPPGLCGTFAPLCLACRISDDFGECCCAPYLPGGLHSLRTGMRERYHIQVRASRGPGWGRTSWDPRWGS